MAVLELLGEVGGWESRRNRAETSQERFLTQMDPGAPLETLRTLDKLLPSQMRLRLHSWAKEMARKTAGVLRGQEIARNQQKRLT